MLFVKWQDALESSIQVASKWSSFTLRGQHTRDDVFGTRYFVKLRYFLVAVNTSEQQVVSLVRTYLCVVPVVYELLRGGRKSA